jgi:hypothetical protein
MQPVVWLAQSCVAHRAVESESGENVPTPTPTSVQNGKKILQLQSPDSYSIH